jgi:hypothetical protein
VCQLVAKARRPGAEPSDLLTAARGDDLELHPWGVLWRAGGRERRIPLSAVVCYELA